MEDLVLYNKKEINKIKRLKVLKIINFIKSIVE
jgi:hypothetical protein